MQMMCVKYFYSKIKMPWLKTEGFLRLNFSIQKRQVGLFLASENYKCYY